MPPQILIDGLGDVGGDITYGGATKLRNSAGPNPQLSEMVLRDIGTDIRTLITGKRMTVAVGGVAIWAGYVVRAARQFWFDVDRPDTLNRRWALTLVDLGILFNKRIVFKQSAQGTVYGPYYHDNVYDDTLVNLLTSSWLDLSADDLDVSSLVERVAVVNPSVTCANGQGFSPWSGGMQWGAAMESIAQVPAAIYALVPGEPLGSSPFGRLVYADVDGEDAPIALSDTPAADGAGGYRECTIWDNGTDLVNEEFAWGAGKGVDYMVFSRHKDDTAIANHGLWQRGDTLFNVWCQETIDAISNTVVNGSPSSRRGHKNDVRSVELVTGETGLRIGQKVRFINHEYGIDQVLPIRTAEITFPTPDSVRTALTLSDVLDRWGFEDPQPPFKSLGGGGDDDGDDDGGGSGDTPYQLFGHYVALDRVSGAWDVVEETDPYLQSGQIEIPAGLGNLYWLVGNLRTDLIGGANVKVEFLINGTGYAPRYIGSSGSSEESGAPDHHMMVEWVGWLNDGDTVDIATYGATLDDGADCQLSAFWLGDKGVALTQPFDSTSISDDAISLDGALVHNTLGATEDDPGDGVIVVPTDGVYLMLNQLTYFLTGPDWGDVAPGFGDVALIPFNEALAPGAPGLDDSAGDRFPTQTSYGPYDIRDLGPSNDATLTSSWIGRVSAGSHLGAIAIADISSPTTNYITAQSASTRSYIALVRLISPGTIVFGARAAGDPDVNVANSAVVPAPIAGGTDFFSWDSLGYYTEPEIIIPVGAGGLYIIKAENTVIVTDVHGYTGPDDTVQGGWFAFDLLKNDVVVASRVYNGYSFFSMGYDQNPWVTWVGLCDAGDTFRMRWRNYMGGALTLDTGFDLTYLLALPIRTKGFPSFVGRGCETGIRVSSTLYQTSQPFVSGSTVVYRAGLFQRGGVDYTEGDASITFDDPILDPSVTPVRICYVAQ